MLERVRERLGNKGFVRNSTRELFRIHGWKNLGLFFHGYYYLSHLDRYAKTALQGYRALSKVLPVSRMDAVRPVLAFLPDRYHGKVVPLEEARKILTLNQSIEVDGETSKKVVPFEIANQIVIRNPDSITVMDCPCRKAKKDPCKPLKVCMIIGEPYASFAMDHARDLNPQRVSQQEAVAILEDCHRRGWVSGAFFNWALGGRFYAICNCCCCCGFQDVRPALSSLKNPVQIMAPSGYLSIIGKEKCDACEACVSRCRFDAISMEETYALVNPDLCMGCGVCQQFCPEEAIEFKKDPSRGIPLDVHALAPESRPQA